MFHLLNVFPNNAAEQEKYYLSNVLKKPRRGGIHQFIQRIEQLNAYVAQLPCWYYSPSYNAGMTPANVPFSKADLASHVLRMCPHQWQDQYNLQENGMTPMDMHSLQASLEAIKRVYNPEKTNAPSSKKTSHKNRTRAKQPSNGATKQAHKKVCFKKSCKLCKKHGGAHTTHAAKDCCKYEKDGTAKANFRAAKKADKKPNPAILCDSVILSNPATLSNPAILRDSVTFGDLVRPSNPVTFGTPSMFSNADDIMLTSPSKSDDVHVNNSTPTASNPTEGRVTAVIAVMRGNPKDGYICQCSNKHCTQKIVWVLLDSGSDGDLIFVN
jgi:hypothetical protein